MPWTLKHLKTICNKLLNSPKNVAIQACLTTAFWGTAWLGEVTVLRLNAFNPNIHIKVSNVRYDVEDRNSLKQMVIFLPWTKVSMEKGEEIFWAAQDGNVDPATALAEHIHINEPAQNDHLFAFKHGVDMRPMTRLIFLIRIEKLTWDHGLPKLQGHSIRIGSTLEYFLKGVPFEVVKAKGRWQGEAFRRYLRKHAKIMTSYIQANHNPQETFI